MLWLMNLGTPTAHADHLPLWELRLGAAGAHVPYYRGAEQSHDYLLPVPFFIYRGETVRADDEGIKGMLLERDDIKLDLSLGFGLPANSDADSPRAGMPELNTTFEIGPSLELRLAHDPEHRQALWLMLPLRANFAFDDFNASDQGFVFAPFLNYVRFDGSWKTSVSLGPSFATSRYHDYFYEVDEPYSNADRPEYHPSGGYSGSRIGVSLTRRQEGGWYGFFLRYDRLDEAQFADSPLVVTNDYVVFGFGMTWRVLRSEQGARHREEPLAPRRR